MTKDTAVENKSKKCVTGRVTSDKMDKTIVVQIERKVKHPLYGKFVKRYTKMYAHDESNQCHAGDIVTIEQTKPLSKLKRWKVVEIIKQS